MKHIETYQQLQATIANSQQTLLGQLLDAAAIKQAVQAIDTCFRDRVLALDPAASESVHGIQVEINKQLRLLKTDCLFLQTAKQADTRDQRLAQMRDRVKLLQSYCEMLLETPPPPSD